MRGNNNYNILTRNRIVNLDSDLSEEAYGFITKFILIFYVSNLSGRKSRV